jgi:hypothetical protein
MDEGNQEYEVKKKVIKKVIKTLYKNNKMYDNQFFHHKTLDKAIRIYSQIYRMCLTSFYNDSDNEEEDSDCDHFMGNEKLIQECLIETFKDIPEALFSSKSRKYAKDIAKDAEELNLNTIPNMLTSRLEIVLSKLFTLKVGLGQTLERVIGDRIENEVLQL